MVTEVLEEMKAENITTIDVEGLTPMCDFFIIATVKVAPQVKAIVEKIETEAKKNSLKRFVEGDVSSKWVLLDLGDVIVHLMHSEERIYYNLEALWKKRSN